MRARASSGDFKAVAIAGTRAILIALNCTNQARKGLLGFAFRRDQSGSGGKWLRSLKVFESVVPKPDPDHGDYRTDKFPVQSFLWSDYTAEPDTEYQFEIYPVYGTPKQPKHGPPIVLKVKTESEIGKEHSIWFNRGAIASQAYARQFKNHKPTQAEMNDPSDKHTKWLSRGLLEACLEFLDSTKPSEKLRACVYEFTYQPVLKAFAAAIERGVDVELCVHDDASGRNRAAMKKAGLKLTSGGKRIVHWRTRTKIPHNKFIIKFKGNKPTETWTGSTNLTASGFLGQSNVGHLIHNEAVAKQYFDYWNVIKDDPVGKDAKTAILALSPYPPALPGKKSHTCIFSPRQTATMLNWYADRMEDATSCLMFTAAFTVAKDFVAPLAKDRDFLRFVLKEKPPTAEEKIAFEADRDLVIAYGAVLGAEFAVVNGKLVAKRKVKVFPLDRWFLKEELTRDEGNIFFVHTKYLAIDPLSDDPLVCTGSANFSENSLTGNDENMVLIRGNTRVADIYLTEFDRLFRHFYFRDVSNEVAAKRKKGQKPEKVFLEEDDSWTDSYFFPGGFKNRRREMFFKIPKDNWIANAAKHSNDEPVRPKKVKPAKPKVTAKKK
jgi:phosphatidylserine/phosphatidylglycerophosphate/cardiolipin synthase-like enzyme